MPTPFRFNYCVSRLRKSKRNYYNNLNVKQDITDNKTFWKTIKPLFSSKVNYGNKIKLVDYEEIIDDDAKVAEELNNVFKMR